MQLRRRELMKLGVFGSAALMLPAERVARAKLLVANRMPESGLPKPFTLPFQVPPVLSPTGVTVKGEPLYMIEQKLGMADILPDLKTPIWGYNGVAPGPTIMARRGTPIVVRQVNGLPAKHPTLGYAPATSTHLHGSASLPQYDGYASDVTKVGQHKDYHYPNIQDARTLWYHDHGVHQTASNAYMGLAAMYILHDEAELKLPIPHGDYDVPLIIKDAMFTTSGELIFDDHDHSGLFGDVILVNGVPWPMMQVEKRKYRFRILNASISRSYELALSTGDPLVVIGTDGGLMPAPQTVQSIRHGMAERYEVVIDFAKYKKDQVVVLQNRRPKNNIDYNTTGAIMAFKVIGDATDTSNNSVPDVLNTNTSVMTLDESKATHPTDPPRLMEVRRRNGSWTINGETWDDVINSGFTRCFASPGLEDVEVWDLKNDSGGWFHPVHIHLVDFRILSRNGGPPRNYERGPKDVAYVGEGETVRVVMRFTPNRGHYMVHCHNLVHEDHDMMVQFDVGTGGDDPITADPAT